MQYINKMEQIGLETCPYFCPCLSTQIHMAPEALLWNLNDSWEQIWKLSQRGRQEQDHTMRKLVSFCSYVYAWDHVTTNFIQQWAKLLYLPSIMSSNGYTMIKGYIFCSQELTDQNREFRNNLTHVWSIDFWQRDK